MADHGLNPSRGPAQPSFGPVVNPATLFRTPSQTEVVEAVITDALDGRAVVAVRGEQGVGKTALMQVIASRLRARGRLVITANATSVSPSTMLRLIGDALGMDEAHRLKPDPLLEQLLARPGQERIVLMCDDAQALPASMFRYIGLLLELFDMRPTKLQVVMLGTPGQWPGLQHPDLELMRQATSSRHVIYPPTRSELAGYVHQERADSGRGYAARPVPFTAPEPQPLVASDRSDGRRIWLRRLSIAALCLLFAGGAAITYIVNELPTASDAPVASGLQGAGTVEGHGAAVPPAALAPEAPPQPPATQMGQDKPAFDDGLATVEEAPPRLPAPPGHRGGPGLVLVAGAGDNLPSLYAKVYRGVKPPPYPQVVAANRLPVKPGALVVFPEPPAGWSLR